MLALLVAALVPTVVMTAALALEHLERCVLRPVPLDRAHVDAAVTRSMGDGNAAATLPEHRSTPITAGQRARATFWNPTGIPTGPGPRSRSVTSSWTSASMSLGSGSSFAIGPVSSRVRST
jgi:hypothetical protein